MHIQRRAGKGKPGRSQLRRTCHIDPPLLSQQHAFHLSAPIANPQIRALLLEQVIHHDLMLDLFQHDRAGGGARAPHAGLREGAPARPWPCKCPRGIIIATIGAGRVGSEARSWRLELDIIGRCAGRVVHVQVWGEAEGVWWPWGAGLEGG